MSGRAAKRKEAEGGRAAREARRAARALREAGGALVGRAAAHLLAAMRRSERCAPWRSGRTLKDLERRSGLLGPASPQRAPLVAPLVDLLLAAGLVQRRAGHVRLAAGCASRCVVCGATEFRRTAAPDPPDDALGTSGRFVCASCGAWCGLDPGT